MFIIRFEAFLSCNQIFVQFRFERKNQKMDRLCLVTQLLSQTKDLLQSCCCLIGLFPHILRLNPQNMINFSYSKYDQYTVPIFETEYIFETFIELLLMLRVYIDNIVHTGTSRKLSVSAGASRLLTDFGSSHCQPLEMSFLKWLVMLCFLYTILLSGGLLQIVVALHQSPMFNQATD